MNNPSTLAIIIVVLSCAAAAIILAVRNNRKKAAVRELNNAARKLVKEQNLSRSLENPDTSRNNVRKGRMRMIVGLSWKDREKASFVFDPLEGIRIGRQPDINNVIIPDDEVSLRHCVLYQNGTNLILEDLGSTNGTVVVHGLRSGRVRGRRYVFDGDRIRLGRAEILLHVFWIDTAYI